MTFRLEDPIDRFVRAFAGLAVLVLLILQKFLLWDVTLVLVGVGLNLLQYGFTGWCPFASCFLKIGWMQTNKKESL